MKEKAMDKVCFLILISLVLFSGNGFPEFVDNADRTVTDLDTGLMWQQTTSSERNWENAIEYCERLSHAGFSDWRMPTREE